MADYLFERNDATSANIVHDITFDDIKKLYRDNRKEAKECLEMTQSSYRGENFIDQTDKYGRYGFYKDYTERDPRTSGYRIFYPHGTVIQQAMRRNFYRGESQVYEKSEPSLLRKLNRYKTQKEKELYRLVADMRVYEFSSLLDRFEHVKNWRKYSDVLYDTLAQHYGLETGWLDITSDFNVALFFANCYYKDGKWYPLKDSDTEIDEQHKYGIIFHCPSWQMSMRMFKEIQDEYSPATGNVIEKDSNGQPVRYEVLKHPAFRAMPQNIVLPIGFQPFMRCSMQSGYGIYMRESMPLQQDTAFEKLRFRHSEKLANWIYNEMRGGELIYPHEGLIKAQFVIDKIRTLHEFFEEALQYAVYRSHYYRLADIDKAREDLEKFKVEGNSIKIIPRHPWEFSALRRKEIDSDYSGFSPEGSYGIQIRSRKSTSASEMFAPWMLMTSEDEPGVIDFKAQRRNYDTDSIISRSGISLLNMVMTAKAPDFY
ncbi:MAG: FRG domain-containing protein [Bilifractor sp.]|nr:FRG domain-containing protein [Lachnospiraceae bacterium]MDY2838269.1 FRG domain-containing protein [Bilifractor sp.]